MVKPQKSLFKNLTILARDNDILISELSARKIVKYWLESGMLSGKESSTRGRKHCKINERDIKKLDKMISNNRELTAKRLKRLMRLTASERSVRRYIQSLGWKFKRTRYCQIVSPKNRIERIIYCFMCVITEENFDDVVFIDETTIELRFYSRQRWFRNPGNEISK
ncbi:unnamed protein product [Brachionus calyciflorus]|uniref:Transposase Tc1-like domain-containing protein n=1 Tax=Brachionus calyciflorus TaxID=104777 RepID=A0A814PTZ1_9BILA|nr:unnamed protein product [Brachionus calyciflorus]